MRRFARDERGTVAIIVALFGTVMIGLGALAVDLGYVFLQTRALQGAADLAAIAAAGDLDRAEDAALATANANGWPNVEVVVERGVYVADKATPAAERFTPVESPTANAVRVKLISESDLFFGSAVLGKQKIQISRTATAARPELAAFSIGSRLASLNGGVANAMLSSLTGSTVSLTVMDYNALAGADVDLFKFSEALANEANIEAASFDDSLETEVRGSEALDALATTLADEGENTAAAAVGKLADATASDRKVKLSRLLDFGPYAGQDHAKSATFEVRAQDLAEAVLMVANEGRQVKLDLGASIPGLADVDIWLAIGERMNHSPWLAVTDNGDPVIRTAQTRLYVNTKVTQMALGLANVDVRLPIVIEAASAEARLADVDCADGSVTIEARPSVGQLAIGEVDTSKLNDFKTPLVIAPASVVTAPLSKVSAESLVKMGGLTWKSLDFSATDIATHKVKTVATDDFTSAVASTLVQNAQIKVTVLGLGLTVGGVGGQVAGKLAAAAGPLDTLLSQLVELTGVSVGEADVRVDGIRCRAPALVA